MAPLLGRTLLRVGASAPVSVRLTTIGHISALRTITSTAHFARKAAPTVEATVPAGSGKGKKSAGGEVNIKVKVKAPAKKDAETKGTAKSATKAASKTTSKTATKTATKPTEAKSTKVTALQARREREAKRKEVEREKERLKKQEQKLREKEKQLKLAARKKEAIEAAKKKQKELEAKKRQRELEAAKREKKKLHNRTMRERKLARAREARQKKIERERAVKQRKAEREKKAKAKKLEQEKKAKERAIQAKKREIETEKKREALEQVRQMKEAAQLDRKKPRPLTERAFFLMKQGKLVAPFGELGKALDNMDPAERAALNAEREAVNAEREAQFQKWFTSQSVAEIEKINEARAWLRKRGILKRGLTPLSDSRRIAKRSGYIMFVAPKMVGHGKATPEILRQAGAEWKALSDDERAAWNARAEAWNREQANV